MSDPVPMLVPLQPSHVARVVLVWFLGTFLASRIMVLMIMTHRAPDLFLHVGATHVHHLNYGIFLLSFVGGALLFRPTWANKPWARAMYGIGLALTFDEFGMWVHLGGSYWQRASYDAVITIGALLLLCAVAPAMRKWKTRHWFAAAGVLVGMGLLSLLMADSIHRFGEKWGQKLHLIEQGGPS